MIEKEGQIGVGTWFTKEKEIFRHRTVDPLGKHGLDLGFLFRYHIE